MHLLLKEKSDNISIEITLEGFSDEIKFDILHYLEEAFDRQKGLQAQKIKNMKKGFKEGYNALPNYTEGKEIKEQYQKAYEPQLKDNDEKKEKPPASSASFINDSGKRVYQLWYICDRPGCHGKGRRYVPRAAVYTECHTCGNRMNVRNAVDDNEFGPQDKYNNYFIAGKFQRDSERDLRAN